MTGFSPESVLNQRKAGVLARDYIYVTRDREGRVITASYPGVLHRPQFRLRIWYVAAKYAANLYVRPVSRLPRRTR